jgi:hypothetical protein
MRVGLVGQSLDDMWGRVLGKLVSSRGKVNSPDNISDVVYVVSVVP